MIWKTLSGAHLQATMIRRDGISCVKEVCGAITAGAFPQMRISGYIRSLQASELTV